MKSALTLALACVCAATVAYAPTAEAASLKKMPSYYDKDRDGYITGFDYVKLSSGERQDMIDIQFRRIIYAEGRLDEIGDWDSYMLAARLKPYIDKFYSKKENRDLNIRGAVVEAINNS